MTTMQSHNLDTVDEHEAGRILGFAVKTMQKRRWLRQAPAFIKVGRKVRYRLSDLQAYLDECTITPERS